jgi:predicted DNA-binding protein (UPF0251 family)
MTPFTRKQRCCRPFKGSVYFKPRGIPLSVLKVNILALDELEAVHLCDYGDLTQAEAAKKMGISTSTLQRLLYSGRKKIIDALYASKALQIARYKQIIETTANICGGRGRGKRQRCDRIIKK